MIFTIKNCERFPSQLITVKKHQEGWEDCGSYYCTGCIRRNPSVTVDIDDKLVDLLIKAIDKRRKTPSKGR